MPIRVPSYEPSKGPSLNVQTPQNIDTGGSAVIDALINHSEDGRKAALDLMEKRTESQNRDFVDNKVSEYAIERAKKENDLKRKHEGTSGEGYYKEFRQWDEDFKAQAKEQSPTLGASQLLEMHMDDQTKVTLVSAENDQTKIFNKYMAEKPVIMTDDYTKQIAETGTANALNLGETGLNQLLATTNSAIAVAALPPESMEKIVKPQAARISEQVAMRAVRDLNFDIATRVVGSPFLWGKILDEKYQQLVLQGSPQAEAINQVRKKYGKDYWGSPMWKQSPLANWLSGPKKEETIRAMVDGVVTKDQQDTDELGRQIENMVVANEELTTDRSSLQNNTAKLKALVIQQPTWTPTKKADMIAKLDYSRLTGETKQVMKTMPENMGRQMIRELKTAQFGNMPPEGQQILINHMQEAYGLNPEIFGLLRKDPTVGTKNFIELTNHLENWYDSYRKNLVAEPASTLYNSIEPLSRAWDELTFSGETGVAWFAANKDKLAQAIGLTRIYGAQADVPANKMNYIPPKYVDKMLVSFEDMAGKEQFQDMNFSMEELKDSIRTGGAVVDSDGNTKPNISAEFRMWNQLANADKSDSFGPEMAIVATLPLDDRGDLLRYTTPKNLDMLKSQLGPDYNLQQFTNVIADNPQWQSFKASMMKTGNNDDKVFVDNFEKLMGIALANNFIVDKAGMTTSQQVAQEKLGRGDFGASLAGPTQKLLDKYLNKHWTSVETGSGAIRIPNKTLQDFANNLSDPVLKYNFEHNPEMKKGMVQVSEVIARRSAAADPGFRATPEFEAQCAKWHEEFKNIIGYDGRYGDPASIRKEYLRNAYAVSDANGGIKFMVNGKPVPHYDKMQNGSWTPSSKSYMVSWDSIIADPDFAEGVHTVSDPKAWWNFLARRRATKVLEPLNEAKQTMKDTATSVQDTATEIQKTAGEERDTAIE